MLLAGLGILFSALVREEMPSFGATVVAMLGVAVVSFGEQLWPFRLKSFANLQEQGGNGWR